MTSVGDIATYPWYTVLPTVYVSMPPCALTAATSEAKAVVNFMMQMHSQDSVINKKWRC
jgi:hypothetical protein